MKRILILLVFISAGCNTDEQPITTTAARDTLKMEDTVIVQKQTVPKVSGKVYSNERFTEVRVENTGEHSFRIQGKGQIFEASFSWVVEDGHDELAKGFQMTDAGAPEWGNFQFTVNVQKKRANSTLHLILYESSAKDGSRQYALPVLLY